MEVCFVKVEVAMGKTNGDWLREHGLEQDIDSLMEQLWTQWGHVEVNLDFKAWGMWRIVFLSN